MLENYYSQLSTADLLQQTDTLAVISYDQNHTSHAAGTVDSGLISLSEQCSQEVWRVPGEKITRGITGNCQWSKTDDLLFVSIIASDQAVTAATNAAYQELLTFTADNGYHNLMRFWNYLPQINVGDHDDENYKIFCTGRLSAFQAKAIPCDTYPAASAVGHHNQNIVIYALASKHSSQHFSNSLQVDAYEYPREYGISSPSFARATSADMGNRDLFFISGTASIVGSCTVKKNDLQGQLEVTRNNIDHLLDKAGKTRSCLKTMKIYVRHQQDFAAIKATLAVDFPQVQKLFVLADICLSLIHI